MTAKPTTEIPTWLFDLLANKLNMRAIPEQIVFDFGDEHMSFDPIG